MPWYPQDSTNAFQDPRKAKATMADVEAAYRRGAQQAAILLLQALSGDRNIERQVRYLSRLGSWRFGATLSRRPPLPKPTAGMMRELRALLGAPALPGPKPGERPEWL
jgi:hypothetical protein